MGRCAVTLLSAAGLVAEEGCAHRRAHGMQGLGAPPLCRRRLSCLAEPPTLTLSSDSLDNTVECVTDQSDPKPEAEAPQCLLQ